MKRAERFGLDVPDDFPIEAIDAIHAGVSDCADEAGTRPSEWHEWASAMNGLVWRFRACDEHGTAVIDSLRANHAPVPEERYHQEKWLFAFFVEGLSAVECLYYGLYFVGALVDSDRFDAGIDRRRVTTGFVAAQFAAAHPSDLATTLDAVDSGEELNLWRDVRNVLAHRGVPPRQFFLGGEMSGAALWGLSEAASRLLDPDQLQERRERVGAAIAAIAEAAVPLVHAQVR